jgi:hypothetical protein
MNDEEYQKLLEEGKEFFYRGVYHDKIKVLAEKVKAVVPAKKMYSILPEALGKVIQDNLSNTGGMELYSTMEQAVAYAFNEHFISKIEKIKQLVELLKADHYTEDNPFVYNDLDNSIFLCIDTDEVSIFCLTSQNFKFIYFFIKRSNDTYELHIRRYYDEFNWYYEDEVEDDFNKQPGDSFKEKLVNYVANYMEEDRFTDYPYYTYYRRPSLKAYKDTEFNYDNDQACNGIRYKDTGDSGFVFSSGMYKVERYCKPEVGIAFDELDWAYDYLTEGE